MKTIHLYIWIAIFALLIFWLEWLDFALFLLVLVSLSNSIELNTHIKEYRKWKKVLPVLVEIRLRALSRKINFKEFEESNLISKIKSDILTENEQKELEKHKEDLDIKYIDSLF